MSLQPSYAARFRSVAPNLLECFSTRFLFVKFHWNSDSLTDDFVKVKIPNTLFSYFSDTQLFVQYEEQV